MHLPDPLAPRSSCGPVAQVRDRLAATRRRMEDLLAGREPAAVEAGSFDAPRPGNGLHIGAPDQHYQNVDEIAGPLMACYWSLWECGSGQIADGRLLDLIRRQVAVHAGLTWRLGGGGRGRERTSLC